MRSVSVAALLFALSAADACGQAALKKASDRVQQLILKLVDPDEGVRKAAAKELVAMGEPVLPALRHAAINHEVGTVRAPARQALYAIERKRTPAAKQLSQAEAVWCVAFLPGGKRLVCGGNGGTLVLWDVESGKEVRRFGGGGKGVRSLAVSADGKRLLSGGQDWLVRYWDLETGEQLRKWEAKAEPQALVFVDGRKEAIAATGESFFEHSGDFMRYAIRRWTLGEDTGVRTFKGPEYGAEGVALSPDGKQVAFGTSANTIDQWGLTNNREMRRLWADRRETAYRWALAYSPDSKRLLAAGDDSIIRLWDAETGKVLQTFEGRADKVLAVAFKPDGKRCLSAGDDGAMRVWDPKSGQELKTFGINSPVLCLAASPDGKVVAGGCQDGRVALWKLED